MIVCQICCQTLKEVLFVGLPGWASDEMISIFEWCGARRAFGRVFGAVFADQFPNWKPAVEKFDNEVSDTIQSTERYAVCVPIDGGKDLIFPVVLLA